jgi:putative mycofactocin binding protein MftB
MDFSKAYGFHHGFAFRRESFGGILYHYEGVRPDPRVTFVDHPFLMDLLERVEDRPLEAFIAEVCAHFSLPPAEEAVVRKFFATLIERGALVESSPPILTPGPSPRCGEGSSSGGRRS